jgi:8-oxo-dGTP pyrophosphatase MutT (NUDIX family)
VTLAERLRNALAAEHHDAKPLLGGDFDGLEAELATNPAAVLVAITDRAEPGLILTQRNANLRSHPGQVAFPGGRIDPGDDGPVSAALREAKEEIGLEPDAVDLVGMADPYRTGSGYHITPVVGVVAADLPYHPAEAEVADVFEVPFAFVLDPANHVPVTAMWKGRERHFYEIIWQDRRIWGATAAMLVNLSRRLQWTA